MVQFWELEVREVSLGENQDFDWAAFLSGGSRGTSVLLPLSALRAEGLMALLSSRLVMLHLSDYYPIITAPSECSWERFFIL